MSKTKQHRIIASGGVGGEPDAPAAAPGGRDVVRIDRAVRGALADLAREEFERVMSRELEKLRGVASADDTLRITVSVSVQAPAGSLGGGTE